MNLPVESKDNLNRKWYALYTKPRTEKKLKLSLSSKNIQNFLPTLVLKKKWSDRIKEVETPIFNSYIFVKIDYKIDSITVLKDPNSVQFVFFEGKPAVISEEEIDTIRIFVEQFPEKIKIEESKIFEKGKEVEINSGPLKGKRAIVETVKNSTYVVVYIPLLNKKMKVEVKKEDIGLISPY